MMPRNPEDIKVVAVAESQQQRLALSDTIKSIGLNLVECVSSQALVHQKIPNNIDLWLVDSQYDEGLSRLIGQHASDAMLVGFSEAPYLNETQMYHRWQRKLKKRLAKILDMPDIYDTKRYQIKDNHWDYVVVLGASMGGPVAIKAFLDNLSPNLPICILLAHHFSPEMVQTLPRVLTRHNDWRCQLITTTQSLQVGKVLIAPTHQIIICDSNGRVILSREQWQCGYNPSINDILKNASDVYADQLIGIIFSGMGDDGCKYIDDIKANNSQIWVQDPNSSASPSQPQAMIDTGYPQFVGTPIELAKKLNEFVHG
ncbi:chemotaxis protein CheB [Moraxella lincolnii]|uniref:protein-glutamate methylesterase n=1 Tax=Lwoffella lincolnii TaxID=90241 RepID=A0A1T0CAX8_9GAMM|nr:chemotaxis protein CheB [Moraxella lincolnii]OOS19500.1 chemotaxis protein CheB [Moraxella lincolnii]